MSSSMVTNQLPTSDKEARKRTGPPSQEESVQTIDIPVIADVCTFGTKRSYYQSTSQDENPLPTSFSYSQSGQQQPHHEISIKPSPKQPFHKPHNVCHKTAPAQKDSCCPYNVNSTYLERCYLCTKAPGFACIACNPGKINAETQQQTCK